MAVTVSARVLTPLVAAVDAAGYDGRMILARSGVAPAVIDNLLARVPRERAFDFVEDAVRTTGDPDLGLHAAEMMVETPGLFGVLEYFARSLSTVRAGLALSTRYARLLEDDAVIELLSRSEVATLSYRHPVDAPRAWNDLLVISACMYVRRFVVVDGGTKAASLRIRFAHARPLDLDELERLFDCPIEFDADRCAVDFRADLLDAPIRTADPALAGVLEPYATQIFEATPSVDSVSDSNTGLVARVRAMLAEELESGVPTAEWIAERAGMSTRTLFRKLSAEGTSFQSVLDRLRHDLASKLLADGTTPIGDVAARLGFSSASAFHHAFRRWTGKSPSDARGRRAIPRA